VSQPERTDVRLGTVLDYGRPMRQLVDDLRDYVSAGVASVTVGEAYTFDAVSQLGYLAAALPEVEIASGILPIDSRTPSLIAMTAAGLDYVSDGRFRLGFGASGPQVMEGFHGVPFGGTLGKTREIIEVCRMVWQRQPLTHDGRNYRIPLPAEQGTGQGKPLKLINHPVRPRIPISLASLGPNSVELTAELAEGWEPIFFLPERMDDVWGEALDRGRAKRATDLGSLEIIVRLPLAVVRGNEREWLDRAKPQLALYVGGMGSRQQNFYNTLARRYGFADAATEIQDLYLAGRVREAAAAVPDELVRRTALIGTKNEIRERLRVLEAADVSLLNVTPLADTHAERVSAIETVRDLLA
jgi:F420-dependent oxidoreductase-like protein